MADATDSSGDGVSDPSVAVVTVAFRSDEVLPALLSSIRTATRLTPFVVIVDNEPSDGSTADMIARSVGAEYVALPNNPGYGAAVNAGVRVVPPSVEWLLICNPDLVLQPDSLDRLLAVATAEPLVGSAGPTILTTEGETYPSARPIPSLRLGVGHALFANIWHSNPWTARYKRSVDRSAAPHPTGWLSGACLLVRRQAFDTIGGFDEGYFMYFEDVDLGYRLGQAGFRNVFVPAASATHIGGHSTKTASVKMIRAHHESAKRFVDRKYEGALRAPIRGALHLGLSLRSWVQQRSRRRNESG